MRGASAVFWLRLDQCSATSEIWLSVVGESVESTCATKSSSRYCVVVTGGGQRLAADALVLAGPILIAVLHVGGVLVAELMRGAHAELGVARGRSDIGAESAGGIGGGGNERGADDRVQVFFSAIERDEEAASC